MQKTENKMKKILEFRNKKYGEIFVDRKKLEKEFSKNEKLKKQYFVFKNNKAPHWELERIKKQIIW